jgi:hypothetical protein
VDLRQLAELPREEEESPRAIHGTRQQEHGSWRVPSRRAAEAARSGHHYLTNTWGDTRLGIGFGEPADLEGVWLRGQSSRSLWARAVRVLGYRNGVEVARSDWSGELGTSFAWFGIGLRGVDRVVFEADPAPGGGGWYALDDLTFSRPLHPGQDPSVLGFDELSYGQVLSGSLHAGLQWELGHGSVQGDSTIIEQPLYPPGWLDQEPPSPGAPLAPGGSATAPTLIQEFEGTRIFDTGAAFIPPDSCGWVGIDHFVEVVNTNYSVFEKAGGLRVVDLSMNSFFGVAGNPGDPRVVFDPDSQRWFVIATNFFDRIDLAASTTSDPTGAYFTTSFQTDLGSDSDKTPDYPTLGVDAEGVYIGCNMFGTAATSTIFALEKAPLIAGAPSLGTVTAFRDLPFEGALQPCVTWGAAPGEYVISREGPTSAKLRRVDPPVTAE